EENVDFTTALGIAKEFFAYTNHTILAEALEKWDIRLILINHTELYKD
ncbi:glycogen/starch/alpha-glucan phosphorylase, partial [Clostridium butyricum]